MHPSLSPRTLGTSLLAALCALGTARSADVKVTEETLVADISSAQLTVSPRGVRVAAVISKGSRQAAVIDGVEGPRFDEIMSPGGLFEFTGMGGQAQSIQFGRLNTTGHLVMGLGAGSGTQRGIFSRDGTHHAHVGRSGSDVVLILDGKEIHRGQYQQYSWLAFTPDGKRLIGAATLTNGQHCIVVDGQPGPVGAETSSVFVSSDSAHVAYTGKNMDAQQTPWMVIDGRQVKHIGDIVGFTATGALFTRTVANYNQVLLANGKPMAQGSSFNHIAIDGNRLVLVVTPALGNPPQKKPSVITVDGQVIAGTEDVGVTRAYFSPDGKRYALLCQRTSPRMETFMIVDGKKDLSYQSIYSTAPYEPSFSPDSSKFLYVAMGQNGMFVVVNGEESDAVQTIHTNPTWSPVGSRLAWGGVNSAQKQMFYLDGKLTPLPKNLQPGVTFRFSADGAHTSWAYGGPNALTLVVDGKEIPDLAGLGFTGAEAVDGQNSVLCLSPDGKHAAYMARDPKNNTRWGMWVDGKLITPTTAPQGNRVTFTPDSQHIAWAIYGNRNNVAAYRIFVDGRELLTYDASNLDNTPGAWEMGADGTLTLVGVDEGALKRYRIPPPADSIITSMLAAAK